MRNLLLALLLANVLYFLYEYFVEEPREYGIAVVSEDALGPPLELADPPPTGTDQPGRGSPGDEESDLAALVGRSCVTVGPFKAESEADAALAEFESEGMRAARRSTNGEVFIGHWVQIRNVANRSAGNEMIEALQEGGLGEAYLVDTDDEGLKISVGLFGDAARAERVELQVKSLGLPAEVTERTRPATVFYVDVGLPPGRGAGGIVNRYGEELVLLRGAATCPGNG